MKQFHKTQAMGEVNLEILEESSTGGVDLRANGDVDLRAKGIRIGLNTSGRSWQCMKSQKQKRSRWDASRKPKGGSRGAEESERGRLQGNGRTITQRYPGACQSIC